MLRIWVTVKPQSRKEEVKQLADGEHIVFVRAPAREGAANRALVEILADHFSVAKSSVKIIRGQTSRKKLVEIG